MISFDEGKSKNWYSDILTVTKGDEELPYTVTVSNGATINADGTITFSKAGDYTVTYTYEDTCNYKLSNGELVSYKKTYYQYVYVTVFVVEPESDPTTFAFGSDGYKTVTAGGLTYAMPNVTATKEPTKSSNVVTAPGIGSKTIDGEKIYYPIIGMHKVGSSMSYYNYFSIFEAVTINDANGTDVYNTDTKALPADLQVIGGFINDGAESANGTAIFNYSTGKTIKTKSVTVKGKSVGLCYYPDSSFSSGTTARAEQTIVVKYCYTDTNGKAYYYYIGYWCAQGKNGIESSDDGCFAPDTLVTLADGTQKRVDQLTFADRILAWDFFTGSYIEKEISLLVNHGEGTYKIANLQFSDGTMLRIIAEHGVFDYDLNKYVYFTVDNMHEYIGHRFVRYAEDGRYNLVTLTNAFETEEYTSAWSVTSADSSNAFASGLLTVAPPEDFYNWIEMDGKLRYNATKFQQDVETYGLYTYDDFKDYVTYEQFVDWNGAYLKIAVEKGYFTFDYILELIELYKGWMPNN